MTFGKPNIKQNTELQGEDALWQDVEYYLANRDDHAMLFNREFFRRVVPFLYEKAQAYEDELVVISPDIGVGWFILTSFVAGGVIGVIVAQLYYCT